MSILISGAFTATGNSASFSPRADFMNNNYTLSVWGTFVGTVSLQRSFDGGITWLPLTLNGASTATFTAPCSEDLTAAERGCLFRLSCTWTSGTVSYRVGQTQ
jgi:hypothetical protein